MTAERRVTGIGGVFFRARDFEAQVRWYREHLGIDIQEGGWAVLQRGDDAGPESGSSTTWSLFPPDTTYFGSGGAPFMINYLVEDLDAVLRALRAEGVEVDERVED